MPLIEPFLVDLTAFDRAMVEDVTAVVREAAQVTAENIVIGGEYGPGAPLDTGFLRASFQVTLNAPADGPTLPPARPKGRKLGDPPIYATALSTVDAARATLDDAIYITTPAEYAEFLEYDGLTRRNGDTALVGTPTAFVRSVALRWDIIVTAIASRMLSKRSPT